MIQESVFMRN